MTRLLVPWPSDPYLHHNRPLAQLGEKAGRRSQWAWGRRSTRKNDLCFDCPEPVVLHSTWAESVHRSCPVPQWLERRIPSQSILVKQELPDLMHVFGDKKSLSALEACLATSVAMLDWKEQLRIHTSLGDAYMLIGWRHAKVWLRPSTCPDHRFWLVALPAKSHCSPKVCGARFLT